MRIIFIGAGEVTVTTAQMLIKQGHEVIIIESDRGTIDALSDELDCSFLQGDGANPAILEEVGPKKTDMLLCLSNNDHANIIAGLVAQSLGFKRVVTSIEDPNFESICRELGLENTIVPGRTISRHLVDMVRGVNTVELSTILKEEARLFTFKARKEDAVKAVELDLPEQSRVIFFYRGEKFLFTDADTRFREGDEIVVLTHSENLPRLKERWKPK